MKKEKEANQTGAPASDFEGEDRRTKKRKVTKDDLRLKKIYYR